MTQAYVDQEATFVNRTSKGGGEREGRGRESCHSALFSCTACHRVWCTHFLSHRNVLRFRVGLHIKKSDVPLLQDVMILTNQWRMSLLFLISAMVFTVCPRLWPNDLSLACISFTTGERALRILIPLVFGMFVIVAPQVYVEWTVSGALAIPFSEFYVAYINPNTDLFIDKQSVIGLLRGITFGFYLTFLCIALSYCCFSRLSDLWK